MVEINIDCFGPLHNTNNPLNLKYSLVIIDRFTHYPEVYPLSDLTTQSLTNVLLDYYIPTHGLPDTIVSDRGSNFTSEQFVKFCTDLDITCCNTTAYRPCSNGMAERTVGGRRLGKRLAEGGNDNRKR